MEPDGPLVRSHAGINSILSQMNLFHTLIPCFINNILQSIPRFPKTCFPFRSSDENLYIFYGCRPHESLFLDTNNIL
jgi:hypothetical protein